MIRTLACALALAGCGTEKAAPEPPAVPPAAVSSAPAEAPAEAPAPADTLPASAPEEAPAAAAAPAPTRADSAAAAAEDVSPEWKQRERSMAPTEQCLRQASELAGEARARVEAACRARAQ